MGVIAKIVEAFYGVVIGRFQHMQGDTPCPYTQYQPEQ